jgi:CRP-like cAMP-binding protein
MDSANFPAFAGMNEDQIEQIISVGELVEFLPGQEIIEQGTHGDRLFMIESGRLQVHIAAGDSEQELATFDAPCVVGELELLCDGEHAASVTALDRCSAVAIPYDAIQRRLDDDDLASLKLIQNLARMVARRLYRLDHKLVDLCVKQEPIARELADFASRSVFDGILTPD